jgi:hypothetical protein
MIMVTRSSETSVLTRATGRNISEDGILRRGFYSWKRILANEAHNIDRRITDLTWSELLVSRNLSLVNEGLDECGDDY